MSVYAWLMSARNKELPRLGDLELAVLDHLWKCEVADVVATHLVVGKPRGITANTVGSALASDA